MYIMPITYLPICLHMPTQYTYPPAHVADNINWFLKVALRTGSAVRSNLVRTTHFICQVQQARIL